MKIVVVVLAATVIIGWALLRLENVTIRNTALRQQLQMAEESNEMMRSIYIDGCKNGIAELAVYEPGPIR